ncbi:pantoate--beta-alanine ligase [Rhizobium leguminosarum]|uniref:pantoate--beta-alanine ligase n=1 Tax=Rhizobium TaxID=379 RepID=UPI0016176D10|nr:MULTISPECIES: pantoate--beta-alanine ligase [Rhizobium]MBB4299432.1 pantoate--beta-alanine ligase [Rhizobium leguminosarum]MBB4436417.1 pantoate--beta-alanine ligase [Rhizobium esperanzae]MBB5683730.1 pantoate--beta-alanine ligase [Rhizobium leguminosarum]MBB6267717.1 pantoate--beta-alanine ligase [Rhizobium leguminosarum]
MRTIFDILALRHAIGDLRKTGRTVGFVPTMGYLHAGHMELLKRARAENDCVVASIFVNPLQFGPAEDLGQYPRDLERDSSLLENEGANILFAPCVEEMYPRPMEAVVDVPEISKQLVGEVRPGHFAGVATVVCKLLNIVQPNNAYFGEKDYQQLVIIRQMVDDLAIPTTICPVPTVRDDDGLALSSRNVFLSTLEREAALVIPKALDEAERLIATGTTHPYVIENCLRHFINRQPLAAPEMIAVRDAATLRKVQTIMSPVVVSLFVRVGTTRLLDNRVVYAKR